MLDYTISKDRTTKCLIVGIVAGLTLGMMLEIVMILWVGSEYMPVVFSGCWLW